MRSTCLYFPSVEIKGVCHYPLPSTAVLLWDKVCVRSSGCPGTYWGKRCGLDVRDLPASTQDYVSTLNFNCKPHITHCSPNWHLCISSLACSGNRNPTLQNTHLWCCHCPLLLSLHSSYPCQTEAWAEHSSVWIFGKRHVICSWPQFDVGDNLKQAKSCLMRTLSTSDHGGEEMLQEKKRPHLELTGTRRPVHWWPELTKEITLRNPKYPISQNKNFSGSWVCWALGFLVRSGTED